MITFTTYWLVVRFCLEIQHAKKMNKCSILSFYLSGLVLTDLWDSVGLSGETGVGDMSLYKRRVTVLEH